ncbi:MAG: HAD hydrolase family protein, partial [Halapricum sp.]
DILNIDVEAFVAVGDSENDVEMLSVAGRSFAVANADERAKAAADSITEGSHMDGLVEALEVAQTRE